MLRGFLTGSFALIVLYVGLQPGSAAKAQEGGNVLVSGLRRLLSGDVAPIHQVKTAAYDPQGKGAVGSNIPPGFLDNLKPSAATPAPAPVPGKVYNV